MRVFLAAWMIAGLMTGFASAKTFEPDINVTRMVEESCIGCHDAGTETGLNFETLGRDLADAKTFALWEKVFDRVQSGEMPPPSEEPLDPEQRLRVLGPLGQTLHQSNFARQKQMGRVPARRLTKLELGYTFRDLLWIDSDVTSNVPDEVESGGFDTVGANQRISAVHMESYMDAADEALDRAILKGSNPRQEFAQTDYAHLDEWHEKPANQGGSITRKLKYGPGIVLFRDVDYLTQFRFPVRTPGIHRISCKVAAYQSKEPLTCKLIVKSSAGTTRLVRAVDLQPGKVETVVVDTVLLPGDSPYLTFDMGGVEPFTAISAAGGILNYRGKGLAILSQKVEGPIFESWPTKSTIQLSGGSPDISPEESTDAKWNRLASVLETIAPRVFRRPVSASEMQPFLDLAKPSIQEGRDYWDGLRVPLRSMLSSPQFLLFDGEAGPLDDYGLANRLSYFLWKSMPDDELFALAAEGKLSEKAVLIGQVDRMLKDEKSKRFVKDFLGQWLRLYQINATTPDEGLYPEFDELLSNAIPTETELFFAELVAKNLSVTHLIDSDFTFLNRRLATHYGISGVEGQDFRRVELSADSVRGGVLTQAAVLKTTANGTTTSPVMRGNFVLTNFLGTPPSPPPPGIGSIEPDTRGKTTIREILDAHRELETCNQCHKEIDPPGFALESFNPIGGFRTSYRVSGGTYEIGGFQQFAPYQQGPPVDPTGATSDGREFSDIQEFKRLLMDQKEQVARNFVSQLAAYATGSEIQFADREVVEGILSRTQPNDYPVRDILLELIQSRLFLNK